CLKIQKRQLTRNELVALNFIILGISPFKGNCRFSVRERPFPNGKHIKRKDPMKIIYYNDNII
ncbi:hypothetical protein PO081_13920, partial [Bacteroides thetaiotaomicron]